jgi:hypothetical protein
VVIREGDEILHVEFWHGYDIVETFHRARMLFEEWDCDEICIDTIGVGAGLYDMFCHAMYKGKIGYPTIRVHCSERAPEDEDGDCAKLRDWLWWKCRKFFRTKSVKFAGSYDDPTWKQLRDEILSPTYKIQNGQIKVEGKDEMKKRGLRSPNLADALNVTFYDDFGLFGVSYTIGSLRQKKADKYKEEWKTDKARSWKTS